MSSPGGQAADRHTIYDRAKQPDRISGPRHLRTKTVHQRVSQHHDPSQQAPRQPKEMPVTINHRQRRHCQPC